MSVFKERLLDERMLNVDMCNNCGVCCERKPCQYYPSDFKKITLRLIETMIWQYKAVIDVAEKPDFFDTVEFRYLVLRAKGERDDTLSVLADQKSGWGDYNLNKCVHLEATGCKLDASSRPGQGLYFIPEGYGVGCFLSSEGHKREREWYENLRIQELLFKTVKDSGEEEKLGKIYSDFVLVKKRQAL